jgi:chorismate mutase
MPLGLTGQIEAETFKRGAEQMTIEDWRAEIDAIDDELLRLLNNRASLAVKVGQSKRLTGAALCDPTREQEVIERAREANPGPLDEQAIVELFGCIIRESRRIEACAMERP